MTGADILGAIPLGSVYLATTDSIGDTTVTDFGPCEVWDALYPCDLSAEPISGVASMTRVATEVLDALTAHQFGECPVTIRPCLRECITTPFTASWDPWPGMGWPGGNPWYATVTCGGGCTGTCSCTALSEVVLPAPVGAITEILIDGAPLVSGAYRVDNSRMLVRTDGSTWPRCNDLSKADTEVGTWSITFTVGKPVPESGKWAVGELACQLLRASHGEDCRLPRSVSRLVRQGVTIEFPDLIELFQNGLTGLYLVDLFVKSTNPAGLRQRSHTYSVDGALARRAGT